MSAAVDKRFARKIDGIYRDTVGGRGLPRAGISAKSAAWLRRVSEDQFIAFSVHCTHMRCPVRWLSNRGGARGFAPAMVDRRRAPECHHDRFSLNRGRPLSLVA
jgi:Rieske Fe-S protein